MCAGDREYLLPYIVECSSSRSKCVQLETLQFAIQHSQQRPIDKLVARFAPLRLSKTSDLHCQQEGWPVALKWSGPHVIGWF